MNQNTQPTPPRTTEQPGAVKAVISAKEKPPLGMLGGSVHDYERGKDPFARECMPPEFQHAFPDKPADMGWLALDWCGNIIGFARDGDVITLADGASERGTAG